MRTCHESIDGRNYKKVHDDGDNQKRHKRVEKIAVEHFAVVEHEVRFAGLRAVRTEKCPEERREDILDESRDDCARRCADDDRNRKVHDIAAQQKLGESARYRARFRLNFPSKPVEFLPVRLSRHAVRRGIPHALGFGHFAFTGS